jgi:hypothetical protein
VSGADAVVEAIRSAVDEDDGREPRRRLAVENSWDVRARALDGLVHQAVAERAGPEAMARAA